MVPCKDIPPQSKKLYIKRKITATGKKLDAVKLLLIKYNSDQICNGLCYLLKQTQFWVFQFIEVIQWKYKKKICIFSQ